jgi:hypothetical protein
MINVYSKVLKCKIQPQTGNFAKKNAKKTSDLLDTLASDGSVSKSGL